MIIAIDGPTASGKSTLAKMLADKLNIYYVSTGALYRALAYILVDKQGYTEQDLHTVSQDVVRSYFNQHVLKYTYDKEHGAQVFYLGEDITPHLKTSAIDYLSSIIATNKDVRTILVEYQRYLADTKDVVMEGRDIGTVVLPHAEIKIFLTASLEERAKRWQKYQEDKGNIFSLEESIKKVSERDMRDEKRKASPLKPAQDAIIVDDTSLNKEETLQKILDMIPKYRIRSS